MSFKFGDNLVVDSTDTVPSEYRTLYTEGTGDSEGKFVLREDVKPLATAYDGVYTQAESFRADKKKASDESAERRIALKQYEQALSDLGIEVGEDGVSALTSYVGDLQGKIKGGEEVKINVDKIKQDYEKRVGETKAQYDARIKAMSSSLERYMVDQSATAALAKHKGSVELLLPHVKSHTKVVQEGEDYVVRVVDSAGDVRSDGKGGWMTVEGLIEEMKTQSAYARAFESTAPGGTGSQPGSMSKSVSAKPGQAANATDKIANGLRGLRK